MAERDVVCAGCGGASTSAVCERCGAVQPPAVEAPASGGPAFGAPAAATPPAATPPAATPADPPVVVSTDSSDGQADNTSDGGADPGVGAADPDVPPAAEQPWHPFEHPSWLAASADPRETPAPAGSRISDGADFMGVSQWEFGQEAEIVEERRRPWLLGALAAVAVIIVLAVIAFFTLRSGNAVSAGSFVSAAVAAAGIGAQTQPALSAGG